jgi:tRNA A-37 threonylcarbamoyl transferase component Bud32
MHLADVIHGDLTTSNMMLRLKQDTSIKPVFDLVSETRLALNYFAPTKLFGNR